MLRQPEHDRNADETAPAEATTARAAPPVVDVHDVTVAYHRRPVLWDVDLVLDEPRLVGIVGPNGAGKSTLIKAILGLVPLASGRVQIFGQEVAAVRRRIGYVPQRESVDWDFPVTVLDVVLMGTYGRLGWLRRPGRRERDTARECLAHVGMADYASRQIGQLSGGQQQRVFLARALAQQADIYFMDEPMAGVDAATERVVFDLLAELRRQHKAVLVVHHDLRTVPKYFDYVVLLNMGVVAAGPTADVFTTKNLQQTYGGRLSVLDDAAEALQKQQRSR
ncbi:MAG: metal ABC transporter ATP-binding protein [Pirellulales bacterium]|nr:metal ABC transporter ATP-binding protein [Pirellulales bacterium]